MDGTTIAGGHRPSLPPDCRPHNKALPARPPEAIYSHPPKASYCVALSRRTTAYCLRQRALSETFGGWLYLCPRTPVTHVSALYQVRRVRGLNCKHPLNDTKNPAAAGFFMTACAQRSHFCPAGVCAMASSCAFAPARSPSSALFCSSTMPWRSCASSST